MFERPVGSDDGPVRLADWIEVELAINHGSLSVDEVSDSLREEPLDSADDEVRRDLDEDDGRKDDLARIRVEEAFGELTFRVDWLRERYPIVLDPGGEVVRLNDDNELFRFLTLLRIRQLVGVNFGDDTTTPDPAVVFEELATLATGSHVGSAVRFGVAGGSRGDGLPFENKAAVDELGRRMNELSGAALGAPGEDFGADVVAWRPFGDREPGQIIVLSQATISEKKWTTKEVGMRWANPGTVMMFRASPIYAVAFVESLSCYDSNFWRGLTTFRSIPYDRLRILSVLNETSVQGDLRHRMIQWSDWAKTRLIK